MSGSSDVHDHELPASLNSHSTASPAVGSFGKSPHGLSQVRGTRVGGYGEASRSRSRIASGRSRKLNGSVTDVANPSTRWKKIATAEKSRPDRRRYWQFAPILVE